MSSSSSSSPPLPFVIALSLSKCGLVGNVVASLENCVCTDKPIIRVSRNGFIHCDPLRHHQNDLWPAVMPKIGKRRGKGERSWIEFYASF